MIDVINRFISLLDSFKNTLENILNVDSKDAQKIERFLDDDEKRVYNGPETPDGVYSVTTVLDAQDNPGKENGLKYWKKNNNGHGDNADWEDILHYKTNRGTLAHYAAFNRFDHKFNHGDTMWTEDEQESLDEIQSKVDDDSYKYSILKDKDYIKDQESYRILTRDNPVDLHDMMQNDLDYVQEEFDKLCREKGIKASTVEEVEAMFARPPNEEHNGYGGQADLLYTDPNNGDHVVADLKTSKRIYDKHKYQAVAYAKAAMEDPDLNGDYIDRCEIIRICPETEEVEVYEITEFEDYWEEFADLTYKAAQ